MNFAPIEEKTQFTKSEMIAFARRYTLLTATEAQFEHWVDYGLIGKGQRRGREQALWSLPQMHLYLQLEEQNQRQGIHPIDFCTIPIWGWLYLGDETDIQREQVERVMQTWQTMQLKHPAAKKAREVARKTIEHIASDHPKGKLKLINDMVHLAETLEYPKPEEEGIDPKEDFLDHLGLLIDPQGKKTHNGPRGASLSAEAVAYNYEAQRVAILALSEKRSLPGRYWTSARNLLLHARAQYQQEQPQFAREVAGKPSAELFGQQTLSEIVTSACRDLRLALGIILIEPTLCDSWEQKKMQSQITTSPLLLPNGTHYTYLHIQGQNK